MDYKHDDIVLNYVESLPEINPLRNRDSNKKNQFPLTTIIELIGVSINRSASMCPVSVLVTCNYLKYVHNYSGIG